MPVGWCGHAKRRRWQFWGAAHGGDGYRWCCWLGQRRQSDGVAGHRNGSSFNHHREGGRVGLMLLWKGSDGRRGGLHGGILGGLARLALLALAAGTRTSLRAGTGRKAVAAPLGRGLALAAAKRSFLRRSGLDRLPIAPVCCRGLVCWR